MKGKKYKRSQHAVKNIYEKYFGIRRPYQVLVDASFCIELLKKKIAPADAIQEVFGGPVKLMTTPCIMKELQKYDKKESAGVTFVARRFELRNCRHDDAKEKMKGTACLKSLIGKNNPHHYCVAAMNAKLRQDIRKVYGVPTVFILRDTVLMEALTKKTLEMAKKKEEKKLLKPAHDDIKLLKKSLSASKSQPQPEVTSETQQQPTTATAAEPANAPAAKPKKSKKKRKGGPNPLSCKKKNQAPAQQQNIPAQTAAAPTKTKKPRKRRAKKPKTAIESDQQPNQESNPKSESESNAGTQLKFE